MTLLPFHLNKILVDRIGWQEQELFVTPIGFSEGILCLQPSLHQGCGMGQSYQDLLGSWTPHPYHCQTCHAYNLLAQLIKRDFTICTKMFPENLSLGLLKYEKKKFTQAARLFLELEKFHGQMGKSMNTSAWEAFLQQPHMLVPKIS